MKKLFILALMALTMAPVMADEEKGGSDSNIVLHTSGNGDWTMHFALGVNVPVSVDDGYKFAPFRSFDINWTMAQYEYNPKGTTQTYCAGIGFGWHNYTLKDNGSLLTLDRPTSIVGLSDFDTAFGPGTSSRWSSVKILSLTVPLQFNQKISKHFSVTLGANVNFNISGRMKTEYEKEDNDVSISTKGLEYRPVTVDFMAIFRIYGVGIYGKFSPMTPIKKDYGPQFKSLSFGLYF